MVLERIRSSVGPELYCLHHGSLPLNFDSFQDRRRLLSNQDLGDGVDDAVPDLWPGHHGCSLYFVPDDTHRMTVAPLVGSAW